MLSWKACEVAHAVLARLSEKMEILRRKLDQTRAKLHQHCAGPCLAWRAGFLCCLPVRYNVHPHSNTKTPSRRVKTQFQSPLLFQAYQFATGLAHEQFACLCFCFSLPILTWARPGKAVMFDRPSASCGKPNVPRKSVHVSPSFAQSDCRDLQLQVH